MFLLAQPALQSANTLYIAHLVEKQSSSPSSLQNWLNGKKALLAVTKLILPKEQRRSSWPGWPSGRRTAWAWPAASRSPRLGSCSPSSWPGSPAQPAQRYYSKSRDLQYKAWSFLESFELPSRLPSLCYPQYSKFARKVSLQNRFYKLPSPNWPGSK